MQKHLDGIKHHIAMIDLALAKLDRHQLDKLQREFIQIITSAQLTLRDIQTMGDSPKLLARVLRQAAAAEEHDANQRGQAPENPQPAPKR